MNISELKLPAKIHLMQIEKVRNKTIRIKLIPFKSICNCKSSFQDGK